MEISLGFQRYVIETRSHREAPRGASRRALIDAPAGSARDGRAGAQ